CLDEEIGERGVRRVVARPRQPDLGVRRYFDLPRLAAEIRDRDAADLGIVLGRDEHLESREEIAVATLDLGAILQERRLVAVGLDAGGLQARRPDGAAPRVAQEDERAPVVARRILTPASDRERAAVTVTGAGRRQHHAIAAVGEQVGARQRVGRGREAARGRRLYRQSGLAHRDFPGLRAYDRNVAGRALLAD